MACSTHPIVEQWNFTKVRTCFQWQEWSSIFPERKLEFWDKLRQVTVLNFPVYFNGSCVFSHYLGFGSIWRQNKAFSYFNELNQPRLWRKFIQHNSWIWRSQRQSRCWTVKSSFKYVVADKLFVQSDACNCKVDNDKILLDVSNIAMANMYGQSQHV